MAKVTFILGLCGAGKTHLAMEMLKTSPAILIDEGFNVTDKFETNYMNLVKNLRKGIDFIIIEMEYRSLHNQNAIQQMIKKDVPNAEVIWKYFENNIEKANKNIRNRTGKKDIAGHIEINSRISQDYQIPENAEKLPIITDPT